MDKCPFCGKSDCPDLDNHIDYMDILISIDEMDELAEQVIKDWA